MRNAKFKKRLGGDTMKRTNTWKKIVSVLLTVVICITIVGCGSSSQSGSSSGDSESNTVSTDGSGETYKDEIHIALNAAPPTLDLNNTTATVARQVAKGSIFEGLVTLTDDYGYAPELAESIDTNDDYTEYVYHLREGVKFHNGQEMKAEDVVASLNHWLDCYQDASDMVGGARFEAVDDYTVKINPTKSAMFFNELMAITSQGPIVFPASSLDSIDPETGLLTEYIGTGPYKFEEWAEDQYILLTKYDEYLPYGTQGELDGWSGYKEAYASKVYYDIVPDGATRVAGLQSGEYDFGMVLPNDNYDLFSSDEYTVYKDVTEQPGLIYNKKQGLATNQTLRQAINTALDMDQVMQAGYTSSDFYRLDSSYMFKEQASWYCTEGSDNYNVADTDKAKELLKEAGYNGETFRIIVSSDYSTFYNAAIMVESQLEAIGMDVELIVSDWATFLSNRADETAYDAFITSFDPVLTPTMFLPLSPTWAGWLDDEFIISGLDEINTATNMDDAVAKWAEVQKYCYDTYMPYSKFGDAFNYSVAGPNCKEVKYLMGPCAWNMKVVE